jgi:hypothetical protein
LTDATLAGAPLEPQEDEQVQVAGEIHRNLHEGTAIKTQQVRKNQQYVFVDRDCAQEDKFKINTVCKRWHFLR